MEKVTNEEVLLRVNKTMSIIWHRKHRWLEHVLRHENFLHDIIEGKTMGKATWGRKRIKLLHDIVKEKD